MNRLLHIIPALLYFAMAYLPAMGQKFDKTILVPADLPATVKEPVKDLAYWLGRSAGKEFEIVAGESNDDDGIRLVWAKDAGVSKDAIEQLQKDGQSFYLRSNRNKGVDIIGMGKNSFINGIYTLLHELGFRWFMPGEAWTIVPTKLRELTIDKIYTPDFQGRFYAGSGGFRAIPGTDPGNTFKDDFLLWNRRNRFSSDYAIKGHSGQQFYTDNKKILDANPSWFCHNKINKFGRINIQHEKVVKVFVEWALNQVKPGDEFPTIGVDPADGAGGNEDCLPANMPNIKSWSDKYFWLANRVAEKLDPADKKTQVQLYAYGKHAAPPLFDLDDNVYPIVIPYAFQRVTSPENMIRLWSKKLKSRPMGIYDYWNITQWSVGIPQFNIYTIPEKLRFWKSYHVNFIDLESTNGKGAMGHALWLASQMMWNTQLSFDSLYNDFLQTCFGPAASDIRRMYDRWSTNYQETMEIDLSLRDLRLASGKTKDPAIQSRLRELKAYIHYLKLYYDYVGNRRSVSAYEKLIRYIHTIHPLRLVHSWPLLSRYIVPPDNYKENVQARPGKPRTVDFEKQFEEDLEENDKEYDLSSFAFDIRNAQEGGSESPPGAKYLTGLNHFEFYLPQARSLTFKVGANRATRFSISDESQALVIEEAVAASKDDYRNIIVKLGAGRYTVNFGEAGRFSRIIFPKQPAFISTGDLYFDNAAFPPLYVYVPADVDKIVYVDKHGPGFNKKGYWLDPDGKQVKPEKLKNTVYSVPVPKKHRGKVWIWRVGHRSFSMLNIPHRFSLANFVYSKN